MIISYLGKAFIKIQHGDLIAAFNPPGKDSSFKAARFGADLAVVSLNDADYNGAETVAYASKTPFIINGPGEYEISGNFVRGFSSVGPRNKINTIYTLTVDNVNICHLGVLADIKLDDKTTEEIGAVDVLVTPIGEGGTISAKDAAKLAASLEPKIIVPILYSEKGQELKTFLKEMGGGETKVDKLSLRKKDLEGKEGDVFIVASQ